MAEARTRLHHRAEALAATLPPLLVAAERVAATISQGVHGRRRIGQGETFWQFRRYQAGDSAGRIDWRQSAKSQPVYIRENEWEAAQSIWLWRDGSPSMAYRSGEALPTKGSRADLLTLALASLLVRGGEHIALIGTGIAPAAGRAALLRIADTIEFGRTAGTSLPAAEPLPRYARLVMVSDFLVPLAKLGETLAGFSARGVKGHLLQVLDPAEETFPFAGRIQFEGPEDEGRLLIGRAESVREDYREAMAAHQRGLEALARQTGWTLATHRTDRPAETPLLALFLALSQGMDA